MKSCAHGVRDDIVNRGCRKDAPAGCLPTKLGYKNPKHINALFVTNTYPGSYWEDQGYNWFGGS